MMIGLSGHGLQIEFQITPLTEVTQLKRQWAKRSCHDIYRYMHNDSKHKLAYGFCLHVILKIIKN